MKFIVKIFNIILLTFFFLINFNLAFAETFDGTFGEADYEEIIADVDLGGTLPEFDENAPKDFINRLSQKYPEKEIKYGDDTIMNMKVNGPGDYECVNAPCSKNGDIISKGTNVKITDNKVQADGEFIINDESYSVCINCELKDGKIISADKLGSTSTDENTQLGGCSQITIWEDIKFSTEYLEYYRNPKTDILAAGNVEYLGDTMLLSSAEYASFNNGEIVLNDIGQSTFGFDTNDNLNYLNVISDAENNELIIGAQTVILDSGEQVGVLSVSMRESVSYKW